MTSEFEPPSDAVSGPAETGAIETLERWQRFGATWRVVSEPGEPIVISMCRCDGGEEVQRLTFTDPALPAWLAGRTSSD